MVRWGYDRFVIYDNGSNDKTVELLKAYPFIEVRNFDTENVFDECKRKDIIKNTVLELQEWNRENGNEIAWITVSDFDEVCFSLCEDVKSYLECMTWCGYNVCTEHIADLILRCDPICAKGFAHKDVSARVSPLSPFGWNKPTLFRLDNLLDFDFCAGNHFARFEFGNESKQFYGNGVILRFHMKHLFKRFFIEHSLNLSHRNYIHPDVVEINVYEKRTQQQLCEAWEQMYSEAIPADQYVLNKIFERNDTDEHGHQLIGYGDGWWG